MSFNAKAPSAFRNLGDVALITATIFFVACNKTCGGKQKAPFVEGGASLILSPDHLTIKVEAMTEDGSDIAVEGCEETTLKSNAWTELHAKGTKVILKGKITKLNCGWNYLVAVNVQGLTALQELDCFFNGLTELNVQGCTALQGLYCYYNKLTALNVQGLTSLQGLYCYHNKLTALNVQGCTALKELGCSDNQLTALNVQGLTSLKDVYCYSNQLNAQAMTELLQGLPAREASDDANAVLYTEEKDYTEGNCKDYSTPEDLKKAFDGAKKRNWTLQKFNASGDDVDL